MKNNTTRFSNRVEDYVKYRPGYPAQIIDFLQTAYGLSTHKLIADIGAGTGISTALFLNAGYQVIAVEPNPGMRQKAIELLESFRGFTAANGTAEHTGIETGSIDAVIAGQAFHWFDAKKARAEFKRILKPGGITALIWNERKAATSFEKGFDSLITKHAREYVPFEKRIDHNQITAFFSPQPMHLEIFANKQVFDFEGLKGRLLSSSFMPSSNDTGYEAMITDLKTLFDTHQQGGLIVINYDTKVFVGRL